jgi:putative FmdB family regulatory protein
MPPIYEYRCQQCQELTEAVRSVADRDDCPDCEHCNSTNMKKIISSYRVHGDLEPYYDDNLETGIQSRQHRERVMKEKNVSEKIGKGWSSW